MRWSSFLLWSACMTGMAGQGYAQTVSPHAGPALLPLPSTGPTVVYGGVSPQYTPPQPQRAASPQNAVVQYTAPQYAAPQYTAPQYTAAQYGAQQYGAPVGIAPIQSFAPQQSLAPQYSIAPQTITPQYAAAPVAQAQSYSMAPQYAPPQGSAAAAYPQSYAQPVPQAPIASAGAYPQPAYAPAHYAPAMSPPAMAYVVQSQPTPATAAPQVNTPQHSPSDYPPGFHPDPAPTPESVAPHAAPEHQVWDGQLPGHGYGGCAGGNCGSVYPEQTFSGGIGCDTCAGAMPAAPCPWFGSLAGLVMTRDRGPKFWTTFESGNNPNQIMNTQDAEVGWVGGFEVAFGRMFGPQCNPCGPSTYSCGIETTFWWLDDMNGYAHLRSPTNQLSTPIDITNGAPTLGGVPLVNFFDNAREHRIWRENQIFDLEINLLKFGMLNDMQGKCDIQGLAGVRYFRFDERLIFGSVEGGFEFGDNGGVNEAYLDVEVDNHLIGFQLGARANYYVLPAFSLYARPTAGIFANRIEHRSQLYRGDGLVGFDIPSGKTDVSFLGQLDLGGAFNFTQNWSIFAAYRVVGVAGVALADNQIPAFIVAADEFADIDSNGNVLVHGAVMGLQCNY